MLNRDQFKVFPPKIEHKEKMLTLTSPIFNIFLEVRGRAIRQDKGIKGIPIRKDELKFSFSCK